MDIYACSSYSKPPFHLPNPHPCFWRSSLTINHFVIGDVSLRFAGKHTHIHQASIINLSCALSRKIATKPPSITIFPEMQDTVSSGHSFLFVLVLFIFAAFLSRFSRGFVLHSWSFGCRWHMTPHGRRRGRGSCSLITTVEQGAWHRWNYKLIAPNNLLQQSRAVVRYLHAKLKINAISKQRKNP